MVFELFAILQMYDFSSKSQPLYAGYDLFYCCLRYCKCTIFQANHNCAARGGVSTSLFAILQMYDFSSKSQRKGCRYYSKDCCLRYCKCTIFQANHNNTQVGLNKSQVVCDTANVRFFKQITTSSVRILVAEMLFAILQMYDFSSKSQLKHVDAFNSLVVCDTANVRFFKQITTVQP